MQSRDRPGIKFKSTSLQQRQDYPEIYLNVPNLLTTIMSSHVTPLQCCQGSARRHYTTRQLKINLKTSDRLEVQFKLANRQQHGHIFNNILSGDLKVLLTHSGPSPPSSALQGPAAPYERRSWSRGWSVRDRHHSSDGRRRSWSWSQRQRHHADTSDGPWKLKGGSRWKCIYTAHVPMHPERSKYWCRSWTPYHKTRTRIQITWKKWRLHLTMILSKVKVRGQGQPVSLEHLGLRAFLKVPPEMPHSQPRHLNWRPSIHRQNPNQHSNISP